MASNDYNEQMLIIGHNRSGYAEAVQYRMIMHYVLYRTITGHWYSFTVYRSSNC